MDFGEKRRKYIFFFFDDISKCYKLNLIEHVVFLLHSKPYCVEYHHSLSSYY